MFLICKMVFYHENQIARFLCAGSNSAKPFMNREISWSWARFGGQETLLDAPRDFQVWIRSATTVPFPMLQVSYRAKAEC